MCYNISVISSLLLLASIMLQIIAHRQNMKQNSENSSVEVADQDPESYAVETPRAGGSATTSTLPSARHARQARPEVAVLGWKERFYRLALRESKA
jgi:hypothetical protein